MRTLAIVALLGLVSTASADEVKTEKRRSRVHAAITVAAIGGAGFATSIVTGYVAKRRYDKAFEDGHCTVEQQSNLCDVAGYSATKNARTLGNISTVGGLVSLGLIATGGILYVTAPRDRVTIAPTVGSDGGGLVVAGHF